ncbi:11909_t:CDS:2 [Diversispora eburnea]|uniref:11909_t:CDS:1 n=1 Tax=Diversispora eburnea TaxID=1213867 RepID=A0A9N9ADI2_9GLOM|nr:11909_t:CDS:2 [Diversispora eburnea]
MTKFSLLGKITLASVIGQSIIVAVLESLVIFFHVKFVGNFILDEFGEGISQVDLIYHLIFIIAFVFQALICIDALRNKNPIQFIALLIFNLLTLLYAVIQLYQHKTLEDEGTESANFIESSRFENRTKVKIYFEARMRPLEYTIMTFISTFSVYLAFMTYKLYSEMEWDNYKKYSGDIKIRKAFVTLSILQTLIKMDIFFIGAYAIQLIPSHKMGHSFSIIETILIFVLSATLLLMSWVAVSREKKYILLRIYVLEVYNNNDTDIENSLSNTIRNSIKRHSKKLSLKRKQQRMKSNYREYKSKHQQLLQRKWQLNEKEKKELRWLTNRLRDHSRYLARIDLWKNNYENPNFEFLKEFPLWLKGLELAKFTSVFEGMKIRNVIEFDEEQLEKIGIYRNAARKVLIEAFEKIKQALNDPEHPSRIENIDEILDTVIENYENNEEN